MSEPFTGRRISAVAGRKIVVGAALVCLAAMALGSLFRGEWMNGAVSLAVAGLLLLVTTQLPNRSKGALWSAYGLIALICAIVVIRIVYP